MRHSLAVPILGVGLLCCAVRCKEERANAPRVPTSGGHSVVTTRDGGTLDSGQPSASDEDAGVFPLSRECKNVLVALESGEDSTTGRYLNAVDEPPDFRVTRVVGTWEPSCGRPTVRVTLSDGKCPDGAGHELSFFFDAVAIANGVLKSGQNEVVSEEENRAIKIRYVRPRNLSPTGEWGSCDLGASGGITLRNVSFGVDDGDRLEALFQVMLPACDGSDNGLLQMQGSFGVQLRRGLDEVCPD